MLREVKRSLPTFSLFVFYINIVSCLAGVGVIIKRKMPFFLKKRHLFLIYGLIFAKVPAKI